MKLRQLFLLVATLMLIAVPALAGDVYNNGPINGNTDGWTLNFGFGVADTFTVSGGNGTITGLTFGAWVMPGDIIESVEVSITSDPFGGTTYFDQFVNLAQSGCAINQFGYDICTESGVFNVPTLADGMYFLNLQNAVVNTGDPVYWDENSGVGCTSPGCPSLAETNDCISSQYLGCIPSESFTLLGAGSATVPEPNSFLLFGSGFLGVIGMLRNRRR